MSSAYQVNSQKVNATPKQESIMGVVERLTYHSEESGYTVARLQRPKVSELTTITGSFAGIQPGQTLQLNGQDLRNRHIAITNHQYFSTINRSV